MITFVVKINSCIFSCFKIRNEKVISRHYLTPLFCKIMINLFGKKRNSFLAFFPLFSALIKYKRQILLDDIKIFQPVIQYSPHTKPQTPSRFAQIIHRAGLSKLAVMQILTASWASQNQPLGHLDQDRKTGFQHRVVAPEKLFLEQLYLKSFYLGCASKIFNF